MATDLTGLTGNINFQAIINASKQSTLTESNSVDALNWANNVETVLGSTYDQLWHDKRTIAKSATDNIDLQGEANSFGHTVVFTSVSNVVLYNSTTAATVATYFVATTGNAQATWAVSDVVQNHTTGGGVAGDDWTGTISHVIDTSNFVILLATGTFATVDITNDIDNDTRSQEDTFTKAVQAAPELKIGVAAANPVDLWLGLTEFEFLAQDEYSIHKGTWTVGAGAKVLKVENLGVIPANIDIIVVGSEA